MRKFELKEYHWHFEQERFDHWPWWEDEVPEKRGSVSDENVWQEEPTGKKFPKGTYPIHLNAVLWEVFRRHPEAAKLHRGTKPTSFAEEFVAEHGLKAWPNLSMLDRMSPDGGWWKALGDFLPQSGFGPRPSYDLWWDAEDAAFERRLREGARADRADNYVEEALQRLVVEHYRAGRTIQAFGFDADFHYVGRKKRSSKAPLILNWLDVIQQFESVYSNKGKVGNLADQYRRVFDRRHRLTQRSAKK